MPTSTITIKYASSGKPAKNKRVSLSINGLLSGGMKNGHTDISGNATIHHKSTNATAKVIIDGQSVGEMRIPSTLSVTI